MSLELVVGGLVVGVLYGTFGVGSALATPLLVVLGVHPLAAVVAPLPGLLPGSAAGAWVRARQGVVSWTVARRTAMGALPGTVAGALLSRVVGGPLLVVASGVVLLVVGARVLRHGAAATDRSAGLLRRSPGLLVPAAALVGVASGLLANGGGFLLVPLFLLSLDMDVHAAAGTSLVVATLLTVPTLITHAVVGDVDWVVSAMFALGLVPGAVVGGHVAGHLRAARLQWAFGALLVGFAAWFTFVRLAAALG